MRSRSIAPALLGSLLMLSACGSSTDSGPSGSQSPITLLTIGPTEAAGFSLPGIEYGAQVAVDELNAAGGIDGRQVKLIVCNDQNDPNEALKCARQAVQEKVAAIVGGFSLFESQIVPVTEKAGIPWVGLTATSSFDSSTLFLTGSESPTTITGVGVALAEQGCKNVAIINNSSPVADLNTQYFTAGLESGGASVTGVVAATANSADWAPTISAVLADDPDCIASSTGPTETGPMVTALRAAGSDIPVMGTSGGIPSTLVSQLGATGDGLEMSTTYLPYTDPAPEVVALKEAILAAHPDAVLDTFSQASYEAVQVVAEAAGESTDVTAASLLKALPTVSGFESGMGPVVDFTKSLGAEGFGSIYNPNIFVLKATGGEITLADETPINTSTALTSLAE